MSFKTYHKIESLWNFDQVTKKHIIGDFYNNDVRLLKDNTWYFTEKVDGTNFRIYWDGHSLKYGGRTDNANFSDYQKGYINQHLVNSDLETLFEQKFQDKEVIVYGELYGEGIQKGGLYVSGSDNKLAFKVFDIEIGDVFLKYQDMVILAKELGYDYVPYVVIGTIQDGLDYISDNKQSSFSKAVLEGLVGKPMGDFRDRMGRRIVVKLKERDCGEF